MDFSAFVHDAQWEESKHPRGQPKNAGEFASSPGGGKKPKAAAPKQYPMAPRSEWYGSANFEKAGGKLVNMHPDEFLAQARPLDIDESSRDNIDDLKRHITSGGTLDPLALYEGGKEDGRHRAHAAKELGITSVPVLTWRKQESKEGKIAPHATQMDRIMSLAHHLDQVAQLRKMSGQDQRHSTDNFVLQYGQPYIANDKTYAGARGQMKLCFMNATKAVLENPDLTYVEGYITVHGVPVHHAWTVDKTGQIYDPTIDPHAEVTGYFGVPFTTDYLRKTTFKNGVYGLLGWQSKSLPDLIDGKVNNYRQWPDPDQLGDDAITAQLEYAGKRLREMKETATIDTPEREALRKKIETDLYNHDLANRKHDRQMTVVLGLPASGKSTLSQQYIKDGAIEIDPDLAKVALPEYQNGIGALAVHEESSAITRHVLARAVQNGDNIVWPRVDSPDKLMHDIKDFKAQGYKVRLLYLDCDRGLAVKSAITRFLRRGRYVPPYLIDEFGDTPRKAFEAVRASGVADDTEEYRREGSRITRAS